MKNDFEEEQQQDEVEQPAYVFPFPLLLMFPPLPPSLTLFGGHYEVPSPNASFLDHRQTQLPASDALDRQKTAAAASEAAAASMGM